MLVTAGRVEGNASSLGYSVFTPGTVLTPVKHETEEVAYTVSGSGELRLDAMASLVNNASLRIHPHKHSYATRMEIV